MALVTPRGFRGSASEIFNIFNRAKVPAPILHQGYQAEQMLNLGQKSVHGPYGHLAPGMGMGGGRITPAINQDEVLSGIDRLGKLLNPTKGLDPRGLHGNTSALAASMDRAVPPSRGNPGFGRGTKPIFSKTPTKWGTPVGSIDDAVFKRGVRDRELALNKARFPWSPKKERMAGVKVSGLFDKMPNAKVPSAPGANVLFNETGAGKYMRPFLSALNGGFGSFNSSLTKRIGTTAIGSGIVGAGTGLIAQTVFPNNFEHQGFVSPILKGAAMGVAAGFLHGSATHMVNHLPANYGVMKHAAEKVKTHANSKWVNAAIGASVWAGTTEMHLTKPLNNH